MRKFFTEILDKTALRNYNIHVNIKQEYSSLRTVRSVRKETSMRCGIKDVAARANVSHTTVSRILRDVEGFSYSAATREKVQSTAREMGYVPNLAARMIRSKKTKLIGIAVQPENSYGTYRAIHKCGQFIRRNSYSQSLLDLEEYGSNDGNFMGRIEYLAGVVCLYLGQERKLVSLCESIGVELPIVTIKHKATDHEMVRAVVNDDACGLSDALKRLAELGHDTVAYVGHENAGSNTDRAELFLQVCSERSVKGDVVAVRGQESVDCFAAGTEMAAEVVERNDVTAVVCGDDEFALGLISGLADLGLRVPEDFSVVGFDDLPFAAFAKPKLTTIRIDNDERMETAVKLLISVIESNDMQKELIPREISLPTRFIERESTAVAPEKPRRPK